MIIKTNKFNIQSKSEQFRTSIEIQQACTLTGLCYITFYANFRKEGIPHERHGKRILFQKLDILEYIKCHKTGDWSQVIDDTDILEDEKLDIKQVCSEIGICYDTFYGIMRRKNLPRFQFGSKIVFSRKIIEQYRQRCKYMNWEKLCLPKK